jgi:hypothetical protein
MRTPRRLTPIVLLLLTLAAAPIHGDDDPRIEPFGGIRWNDRIQDVLARMEGLSDGRKAEVSLVFHDRVSPVPFGSRMLAPGHGPALEEAISAITRDYLDRIETNRKGGDDRLYRAFNLHVLGMLFDKSGVRKGFLDAEIRLTVRQVMLSGVPFEMTAVFQANPGAGLTERYVIPASGTKYVLPVVLTQVTLTAKSAAAHRKYPEIEASLARRYEGFRSCTVDGGKPGRCDARPVSVAWTIDGDDAVSIRYNAEKYWEAGLEAVYKEHLATVEGRSKRCHGRRAVDA